MPSAAYYKKKTQKQVARTENPDSAEQIQRYLDLKRAAGVKWGTLSHNARSIADLANQYPATPLLELERRDLVKYVAEAADSYADSTMQRIKVAVKNFYQHIHPAGDAQNKEYPDVVKWLNTSHNGAGRRDPDELITRSDVRAMIEASTHPRDKAIISTLYFSGLRRGEFLGLNVRNVEIDGRGAVIRLRRDAEGQKTGTRRIRLVDGGAVVYLQNWLNNHPGKEDPDAPLWISLDQSRHGDRLSEPGLRFLVKKLAKRGDVKRKVTPHGFRHARATELSQTLNEAEMRIFFGWSERSNMPSRYIHLSGGAVEEKLLREAGLLDAEQEEDEDPLEEWVCGRCGRENAPDAPYCNCGMPRDEKAALQIEEAEEKAGEDAVTLEALMNEVQRLRKEVREGD